MAKTVFDIKISYKNMFSPFSSVFALKQAKETNFVSGVTFDNFFFFLLILGYYSKFSEALRPRKEAT